MVWLIVMLIISVIALDVITISLVIRVRKLEKKTGKMSVWKECEIPPTPFTKPPKPWGKKRGK